MTIQKITADLSQLETSFDNMPAQRVETGIIQINDDWPSVHIRGDDSMMYSMYLRQGIEKLKKHQADKLDVIQIYTLEGLADLLESSRIG